MPPRARTSAISRLLQKRAPLGSAYKQEKHGRRQREILDAAAATFGEKGFHSATMEDVARRLGMRPASIYHYLASKEAALEAVCHLTGEEFLARLTAVRKSKADAPEMIRRGIELHLRSEWLHYVMAFAFYRRSLPVQEREQLNVIARQYLAAWEAIVRFGMREGSLRRDLDARLAAAGLVAMCNGVVGWFAHRTPQEAGAVVPQLAALLLEGLKAR